MRNPYIGAWLWRQESNYSVLFVWGACSAWECQLNFTLLFSGLCGQSVGYASHRLQCSSHPCGAKQRATHRVINLLTLPIWGSSLGLCIDSARSAPFMPWSPFNFYYKTWKWVCWCFAGEHNWLSDSTAPPALILPLSAEGRDPELLYLHICPLCRLRPHTQTIAEPPGTEHRTCPLKIQTENEQSTAPKAACLSEPYCCTLVWSGWRGCKGKQSLENLCWYN